LALDPKTGLKINGTAAPNAKVDVRVDGKSVGTTIADGSGAWSYQLPAASAKDGSVVSTKTDAGTSNEVTLSVPPAPTATVKLPEITVPSAGLTIDALKGGKVNGTADPNVDITVQVDGKAVGTAKSNAKGDWIFNVGALKSGSHVLSALDKAGASADVPFTVPDLPGPVITVPDSGLTFNPSKVGSVTGTAAPNAKVNVFVNDKAVGSVRADGQGKWRSTIPGQKPGEYVITAKTDTGTSNAAKVTVPDKVQILLPTTGGEQ